MYIMMIALIPVKGIGILKEVCSLAIPERLLNLQSLCGYKCGREVVLAKKMLVAGYFFSFSVAYITYGLLSLELFNVMKG